MYINYSFQRLKRIDKSIDSNVKTLKINDNLITQLDKYIFNGLNNLKILDFSNNQITQLDKDIFNNLNNLRILRFSKNQITPLDKDIFNKLNNLTNLYFNNNQIIELDKDIFNKLNNLKILDFNNNQIIELDKDIFNKLNNLKILDFNNNQIIELDKDIFNELTNLTELDFKNNQITQLDKDIFNKLNNLTNLYFSNNQITQLDKDIFNELNNLTELDFKNNQITELDKDIFYKFNNLTSLSFSNNQITKLDKDIFNKLNNLTNLYFSNNQITQLDKDIFNKFNNLNILRFRNNQIKQLDKDIFNELNYLTELDFKNNQITQLDKDIFNKLSNLEILSFSNNQITQLDKGIFNNLNNLTNLYFSNNQITELDKDIFNKLNNLKILRYINNQITQLDKEIFNEFNNLTSLSFSNNQITKLDKDIFNKLNNLTNLYFSNNQITELDKDIFNKLHNLKILDFSNNQITQLDKGIFNNLNNLTNLYFSNNQITQLDKDIFERLPKLECINIFNNRIKKIEINFGSLVKLKVLNISSNNLSEFDFECCFQTYGEVRLSLDELNLNNNFISFIRVEKPFSRISISRLLLNGNRLQKLGEEFIKYMENNPEMTVKFLYNCFDDDHSAYLESLGVMLNSVNLSYVHGINLAHVNFPQIQNLKWLNIPMFSVVTGGNGFGKTSILRAIQDLLYRFYLEGENNRNYQNLSLKIRDDGKPIYPVYLQFHGSIISNNDILIKFRDILHNTGKVNAYYMYYQLDELTYKLDGDPLKVHSIGSSILSFYSIDLAVKYLEFDLDILNKELKIDGFKYELQLQQTTKKVLFKEFKKENIIEEEQLSPGEKLILLFLLWKFIYSKYSLYGRTILLLDEPDSHLHPTAVREVIEIIKKLVDLGIQVIMTTHNPTTISLIKNENIFLLSKNNGELQINRAQNKKDIYEHLTPKGLINIDNFYKIVFIEGKTDKPFYNLVHEQLINENFISDDVNLAFIPLQDEFQSKFQVLKAIEMLLKKQNKASINNDERKSAYYEEKLESIIYAIVDDDNDKYKKSTRFTEYKNLHYLERYSFENYLWDPINIFFYFINKLDDSNLKMNFRDILKDIIISEKLEKNKDGIYSLKDYLKYVDARKKGVLEKIVKSISDYIFEVCFEKSKKRDNNILITVKNRIFDLKIQLYKTFNLYNLKDKHDPLKNQLMVKDGYTFDPLKEYFRLKYAEKFLQCELSETFKQIDIEITKYNDFANLFLEQIFQKPSEEEIEYKESLKKIIDTKDLKNALIDMGKIVTKIRKELGKNDFEIRFDELCSSLETENLDNLKEFIEDIFAKELKKNFEEKGENFIVRFKNIELAYPAFFFKMRGHDLVKICHKVFLKEESTNIFAQENTIKDFNNIGLFLSNEIRKIYQKLTKFHEYGRYNLKNYLWDPLFLYQCFRTIMDKSKEVKNQRKEKKKVHSDNKLSVCQLASPRISDKEDNKKDEQIMIKNDFKDIIKPESNEKIKTKSDEFYSLNDNISSVDLKLIVKKIVNYVKADCFQKVDTSINESAFKYLICEEQLNKILTHEILLCEEFNKLKNNLGTRDQVHKLKNKTDDQLTRKKNYKIKLFTYRINLYLLIEFFENSPLSDPLAEILYENTRDFDTFKEYLKMKWMKDFLEENNYGFSKTFQNMNARILKINSKVDDIINELNIDHGFSHIYKACVDSNVARKNVLGETLPSVLKKIDHIDNDELIEFLSEEYNFDLSKIFVKVREKFNELTIQSEMHQNLNHFVFEFTHKLPRDDLEALKETIQKVYIEQLETELTKTINVDYRGSNLEYPQYFFKIREHQIGKLINKVFCENSSFKLSSVTKDMEEFANDFDKLELIFPIDIKQQFRN